MPAGLNGLLKEVLDPRLLPFSLFIRYALLDLATHKSLIFRMLYKENLSLAVAN
jgi:hypothetical protein